MSSAYAKINTRIQLGAVVPPCTNYANSTLFGWLSQQQRRMPSKTDGCDLHGCLYIRDGNKVVPSNAMTDSLTCTAPIMENLQTNTSSVCQSSNDKFISNDASCNGSVVFRSKEHITQTSGWHIFGLEILLLKLVLRNYSWHQSQRVDPGQLDMSSCHWVYLAFINFDIWWRK